ncbi:MAG: aminotransferase class I/II-fold pyridoxal phosphate-dependent enzyme, partial [Lachnospiraceae bacterium]|nr:aminotransferase class I/II-fold pyridoxal phosphate-dependent enzyme [Lachnospiraceae bacterium]
MPTTLSSKGLAVKSSSTLEITAKAKAMRASGIDVVTFGAGEPDFPTPENICEAAIKAIRDGKTKYTPASGIRELKEAVSKKFKDFNKVDYAPEQIVISNGGKQTLHNIFSAIINSGDEVIVPVPYWLTYPEMIRLVDGVPVFVQCTKENNFKLTAEDLLSAITPRTKAVIINNPQNPTGTLYTKYELETI